MVKKALFWRSHCVKKEAFPNIDTLFLSNTPGLSDFFGTQYVDSYPKCRSNLSHWISTIILPCGTRPWHRFLIEARATCLVAHLYTGYFLTIEGGRCTHTNHYRACWKSTVISAVMLSNIFALTYLISWQKETMVRYSVLFLLCLCVSLKMERKERNRDSSKFSRINIQLISGYMDNVCPLNHACRSSVNPIKPFEQSQSWHHNIIHTYLGIIVCGKQIMQITLIRPSKYAYKLLFHLVISVRLPSGKLT